MKQVTIDPRQRIGRIDGGVLSGEFTWEAGRHGLAPVLGQCAGVGAAGVTLGGGLGWLSGRFGAACDNLLSTRLLTADGRFLQVDASSNPDLFWAIRGGSGNFGVATSLEFRLHPVGSVTAGQIRYRLQDARAVLGFYRDLMGAAPDWFQADVSLNVGDRSVLVDICHTGDATEGDRLLGRFRSVASPSEDTVKIQSYTEFCGTPPQASRDEPIPAFLSSQGVYVRDIIVYKTRYSGFYNTELDAILKRRGIRTLVMTGCTTSVCVESTLRDAMFRDYTPVLLADCAAEPIGQDLARSNQEASVFLIQNAPFGSVTTSADFAEALAAVR